MLTNLVRRLDKCDPRELLYWVSACQLPPVNKERAAIIEYALGVLSSSNYTRTTKKRKISRELIRRIFSAASLDFREYTQSKESSKLQVFFPLGFLRIRGEAFPWQFAEAATDRYGSHSGWMLDKLGFTIFDAVDFSKGITKHSIRRSLELSHPSFPPFTKEQYYNPEYVMVPTKNVWKFWKLIITFSKATLESLFPKAKHERLNNFLRRMSFNLGEARSEIQSPLDFNILHGKPFVRIGEDFLLVVPRLLWHVLSTTFHYDLLQDEAYRGKYIDEKGKVAEKRMITCFSKIFFKDRLSSRVKYNKRRGWPDIDLIAKNEDTVLFVECTAKWITREAKRGNLISILNDLKSSIEKCSNQLARASKAYQQGRMGKLTANRRVLPVIVVDDYIPGLDLILGFCNFVKKARPYIISIFDLDIITDLVNKEDFIDFISKRIELSKRARIFAADEIDYFVLYKAHGFEEYLNLLEKGESQMQYIGHLENLYPTYYKEHFLQFLDDPALSDLLKKQAFDWETGWS